MMEPIQAGITPVTIHPMEYRAILTADIAPSGPEADTDSASTVQKCETRIRELEGEIERQSRSFEAELQTVRVEACEQGRTAERHERAARMEAAAQALTAALLDFARERDRYLAQVEQEVVRLALAIAARVLHREALMDPLLLAGAVRVALGQLADTTEVQLKVPAREQEMWSEMLRLMPNLPLRPEVIADDAIAAAECLLETHAGSVDLGVRSQLAEIERGFFDLLEQRNQRTGHVAQGAEQRSAFGDERSEKVQGAALDGLDVSEHPHAVPAR
ncbi:MAG: FliH/SctL family protein [Acidobacteriaceae bacterium]